MLKCNYHCPHYICAVSPYLFITIALELLKAKDVQDAYLKSRISVKIDMNIFQGCIGVGEIQTLISDLKPKISLEP